MNKQQNKLSNIVHRTIYFSRFAKISGIALFVVAAFCLLPPAPTVDNEATAATTYLFSSAQTAPTMALTTDKSTVSITATPNNTLATSTVASTVTTNNYAGYKLTTNLSSTTTNLTHSTVSSKNIPSITSTYTTSNFPSNYWGVSTDTTNYQALPASNATALQLKNQTAAATNQTTTLTIGTKVSDSQAAGTYTNSMVLTATANPANYTIIYNKNTTDTVSNLPSAQTGTVSANAVTLSSNTPTRTGYTFLGWSEDASATTASLASGASVYMNQTQSNASITLYAVWKINTYTVTFNVASSSNGYGTVDKTTLTVNYGSVVSSSSNTITVAGTKATATAANQTAQYSYAFNNWTNGCGSTVTGNCTISANFTRTTRSYTVTFAVNTSGYGTLTRSSQTVTYGGAVSISGATATVAGTVTTATASSGYELQNWTNGCGTSVITACTITANFKKLLYMQDIADYADSMVLEQQYQMIDKRDGKIYWVAKLADGNIWMTQNLDYDIVAGDNIVSNLDGTTSIWNTSSTYAPQATTTTIYINSSTTGTYSYDPGSNYLPNGTGTPTDITCTSTTNGGENCHYHQGNYYQYNAATAGTGGTITKADATSSICPKGWRLPTSNSTSANYSFGNLVKQYGYSGSSQTITDSTLLSSPLFFARGGFVFSGSLYYQGFNGSSYWSSRADSNAAFAYSLDLIDSQTFVDPSGYSQRDNGFSVRCVAIDNTLNGISTMQEMTPAIVAATPENTSKQLIDTRDNKLYWVTKLADGNIWMTQNLDYDIVAGDNIVSNNDGTTSTWNTSSTYAPQVTTTTVFNDSSATSTYSYDPGSNYLPNGTDTPTAITCTSTSNGGENCHYHQGNYYQYNAATAGTGGIIANLNARSSICPKGWRLPISDSYTENYSFGKLTNAYGITNNSAGSSDSALLASPLFFVRGGFVTSGSLSNQASYGAYLSSLAHAGSFSAYGLYFYSSGVNPSRVVNRYNGSSVRCVAIDPTLNDISTMQEMTPAVVAATPENTSKQLTDTRDNKTYWVTKLADGNIWMTQNLDYDIKSGDNIVSNNDGTTSIWNASSTYAPQATTTTIFNNESDTGTYSYDPGNYYWNGTTWLSSNNNTQGYSASDLSTAFSTTAPADGGTHYHVGNLYQYNAATAGTGGTITSKDATSSICPKGWRLPTSNSTTANYSFGKLINAYNVTTGTALAASPLRFVPAGSLGSGKLSSAGCDGYYWHSMAHSDSSYAYYLNLYSRGTYTSLITSRYYGYSVRCVAI